MAEKEHDDAGAFEGVDLALRVLMEECDLSLSEVGRRVGMTPSAVRRYVTEPLPRSVRTLGRIVSEGLGLSAVDLLEALVEIRHDQRGADLTEEQVRKAIKLFLLRLNIAPSTPDSGSTDGPES